MPGVKVSPLMSPGREAPPAFPARLLYAVVKSNCAWAGSGTGGTRMAPETVPGGKPVTDEPGLRHTSPPVITVGPVLVTVDPARMAHPAAAPSGMAPPPAPAPAPFLSPSPHDVVQITSKNAMSNATAETLKLLNTRMRIVSFSSGRLASGDFHDCCLRTLL